MLLIKITINYAKALYDKNSEKGKEVTQMMKVITLRSALISLTIVIALISGVVFAGHNGAVVTNTTAACGETTFSATITDPNGTHKVDNMRLVVHDGDATQFTNVIPTDGSNVSITVGPFFTQSVENQTLQWRVFGGGERSNDNPLWSGFGGPTFSADVNAYGAANGFGWVVAGPDDPNPFTTWHTFDVQSCAITKDMCMGGGWEDFGFRNQGQCIRFVNTGQDSR